MIHVVRATVFGVSSASTAQHSPAHRIGRAVRAARVVRPLDLRVRQALALDRPRALT